MTSLPKPCGLAPDRREDTFVDVLISKAERLPDAIAFRYLGETDEEVETITYLELAQRAEAIAAGLVRERAEGGPVIVAHAPGCEFIAALLGCWRAGAIAVPCYPPRGRRHRERLAAVVRDCDATVALADPATGGDFAAWGVRRLPAEDWTSGAAAPVHREGICLLQYTSGSTARPKGVKVSHANLLHQARESRRVLAPQELRSLVSWLPPYHDMGLVLKILHALESGLPLTAFTPEAFSKDPLRWLRTIHRYRGDFSGAPNFAWEMCLRAVRPADLEQLDLSSWKLAPCGAERVRAETLQRFARTFAPCGFRAGAFLPGYGLAEATLIAASHWPGDGWRESHGLVSCGRPFPDTTLRIAEPESGALLPAGAWGEIQVRGPGIAAGYRHREEETAATFLPDGWLRTGDLGFLDQGHLFVAGRLKDLVIVDGVNHAPEDIERAAAGASPRLTGQAGAAFSLEEVEAEAEALVVLQECPALAPGEAAPLCQAIRAAIGEAEGVAPARVMLIRPGTLPRTTSGKIRRSACREALQAGSLRVLYEDAATAAAPPVMLEAASHQAAFDELAAAVREATGRPAPAPADDPAAYGLGSVDVTRIVALLLARTGRELAVGEVYAARSFAALAERLSTRAADSWPAVIPTQPAGEERLLSHSQERMWFLHQLDPASAAYHVAGALDLEGPLDLEALQAAYRAVLQRHEILRSRHGSREGRPRVVIDPAPPPGIAVEESTGSPDSQLTAFIRRPFDLATDSPVRALLLRSGPGRHVLALCAHHIVADGWSIRVLLGELCAGYRGEPPAPPLSPGYFDYAAWHRRWIESGGADRAIDFWRDRLQGHAGTLELPLDFPRPPQPSSEGAQVLRALPADLLEKVRRLATAQRTTPFAVFFAAWLLLLRRHGAGDDPVVAVPVANRHHAASGGLIGTLVNTLPFRLPLGAGETFAALVGRVREASLEMLAAQDAPFERIIAAVQPERALDRSPLAQVMFDHQEIPFAPEWSAGLTCRPRLCPRASAQFDLSLLLFSFAGRHEAVIEYRRCLFRPETAAALIDRYLALLEATTAQPDREVRSFDALTPQDRAALERFARGPQEPGHRERVPLQEIVATARRAGERTAIRCEDRTLSYAALLGRVEGLAAALGRHGIRPGDRVAVLLERDEWLPAALLAIWLAGAAYVPLDAANPPERLGWILEDQQPITVLAAPSLTDRLPPGVPVLPFDPAMAMAIATEALAPDSRPPLSPQDPAYILYTSGSTGRPKGVVVPHSALANFLLSMQRTPGFHADDRLAAITTVSFDISALELFLPLLAGACLDLIPTATARDGQALRRRLEAHPPTVLQATPATWRMLLDAGWQGAPDLRVLCGGEALDTALANRLTALGKELWNLYGPTETTVWSTLARIPPGATRIDIGRPIANTLIRITDAGGLPVPPGVAGELRIGGEGLATGYWRRPELTAQRFIGGGERLYLTGDGARWLPDGAIECLGRCDGQVKIRGFRVELGEVEAALLAHPAIAEAAAGLEESGAGARLVAYLRKTDPAADLSDLDAHLRARLPDYMVPAPCRPVVAMPLTSSGKIDRRALAALPADCAGERCGKTPPQGPLEAEIAGVWQRLLECGPVGRDEDFFALGGHSLLAARMAAELSKRLGAPVALDALFQRPTVAGFAARLGEVIDLAEPRAVRLQPTLFQPAASPPLFWIHTLVDGGMGLFPYREAAQLLESVDSYGIAEGVRSFGSLGEMAARHVAAIRHIQPHGPYRLTGFCFGGNLAAEIACQLEEAGETVALLALLEARPPDYRESAWAWLRPAVWRRATARIVRQAPRFARYDAATLLARLRIKHRALAAALDRWTRPAGPATPDLRGVLDLSALEPPARERVLRHWAALHRHPPRLPQAARIVIVRADDDGWLPTSPALGWDRHTAAALETRTVPGRHEDFLRGGSAAEVAATLKELLELLG